MPNSSAWDVIADHALETERNLRMATQVAHAFGLLKERIFTSFLEAVEAHLNDGKETGWVVSSDWRETGSLKSNGLFSLTKEGWRDCCVGLWSDKQGCEQLEYFVWVESSRLKRLGWSDELKQKLDLEFLRGRQTQENPWWQYLEDPLKAWTSEDALVALSFGKEGTARKLSQELLTLARLAEPFLNSTRA